MGCGLSSIIRQWYGKLPEQVRVKVINSGFQPLIDGLSSIEVDNVLIQALAEKWWDTTHTF